MYENISFGNRRLVGQEKARQQIERVFASNRLSHAYLFTGPRGSGKTAFALAMAEVINAIDHYTSLDGEKLSKKSSWYTHPDIHVFIPLPTSAGNDELKERLKLLHNDPYEIVDFTLRPVLTNSDSSKNLQAFYPIKYYHEEIRPVTVYKPNEGKKTVVVITEIETMRKETANAFLKLLEEPSENVVFLLTATKTDQLLPTIISRCQQIRMLPLSYNEVAQGLVTYDNADEENARLLARISGGSYSLSRFFDLEDLQAARQQLVDFLRYSYTQDVSAILGLIDNWNKRLNRESQIALCNTLEQFLRDILIFRESNQTSLVTNIDQINVIKKFCTTMVDANIEEMIEHLQRLKVLLYQNVQLKYIFSALSLRYASLMRGNKPEIDLNESWKHLPALTDM